MKKVLLPILAVTMVASAALLLADGYNIRQVLADAGSPAPEEPIDQRVVPDLQIIDTPIGDDDDGDPDSPDSAITYYNWLKWQEGQKIYNFGPEPENLDEYAKPYGELLDRLSSDGEDDQKKCDPRLEAAEAYAISKAYAWILDEEEDSSKAPSIFVNEVAERLESDVEYRKELYSRIEKALDEADVKVVEIGPYTSTMYMVPNQDPNHPIVTVDNSVIKDVEGDHALLFAWPDGKTLKLRIDCGYQPMIEIETEEPPTTSPPTTNPPETNPPPQTTVTTSLASKDTKQAVDVSKDPDNAPSSNAGTANTTPGSRPTWQTQGTSKAPETTAGKQPATQNQQTATQPQPTKVDRYDDMTWRDLKDVAGNTPSNAAVADDPVNSGTVPNDPDWWANW